MSESVPFGAYYKDTAPYFRNMPEKTFCGSGIVYLLSIILHKRKSCIKWICKIEKGQTPPPPAGKRGKLQQYLLLY